MAQSKKTTTSSRSASTKPKTTGSRTSSTRRTPPAPQRRPIRREVGCAVCLLLGLLSCIGYFNIDAWFIRFFCGFIKGIFGWGYFIFPPALILAGFILMFHRGRPIALRVTFALLLPLLFGAFVHLIASDSYQEFGKGMIAGLYKSGLVMKSGGFLAGLLAITLRSAVSVYGAVPLLLAGFLVFLILSLNLSVSRIIGYFRGRPPRPDYVPMEEELPPTPKRGRGPKVETFTEESFQQEEARPVQAAPVTRPRRRAIDIPLDGEEPAAAEESPEQRVGFFNTASRVRTPDQLLETEAAAKAEQMADAAPAAAQQKPLQPIPKGTAPKPSARSTGIPPTEQVEPLSLEEAADIAGVTVAAAQVNSVPSRQERERAAAAVAEETERIASQIEGALAAGVEAYRYPSLELLRAGGPSAVDGREEIALNRERLDTTLRSFGVHAAITSVTRGPTVTRYDLELEAGVKLTKLTNLAGDLALSLGVASVRIAPIPDKISTVGVEVPNKLVSTVYLRDIIGSDNFQRAPSKLSFAIGKDIGGNAIVGNIAKLPHMLIAGTTGSGKSVCMNSLILSLLYKATPDEVRLIMIDPKMVELGIYNGIPHLFIPVVTDPKKAAGALQWAVVEMLKRYRLFSEIGVRDLAGYNKHQRSIEGGQTLPQVVIVIDELADLMLVASKEVEESICRVAQMGRASGMHLVIATQRPSADVITGLMKANIPSRIAFAVSSALESRIILDSQGAEKLIGQGDMLYAPLGSGKPLRVQGAFVTDEERERVINFIKEGSQAQYDDEIMAQIEKAAEDKPAAGKSDGGDREEDGDGFSQYDELLPQAVEVIFETKQASVSMLQRRLKLGYSRAARLVDQLEEVGVVGPFEGSKPRQIMITKEQWREMQTLHGTAPLEQMPDMLPLEDEDIDFQEVDTTEMDH